MKRLLTIYIILLPTTYLALAVLFGFIYWALSSDLSFVEWWSAPGNASAFETKDIFLLVLPLLASLYLSTAILVKLNAAFEIVPSKVLKEALGDDFAKYFKFPKP